MLRHVGGQLIPIAPQRDPQLFTDKFYAGFFQAITLIGIAGFAWAGCPILAWDAETAQKQKQLSIRGGVLLYFIGTVVAGVAVLAVPA